MVPFLEKIYYGEIKMTERWRLLKVGGIDPLQTQMIYEAVALARDQNLVPETIIFCWPNNPLVCVGFHQEVLKEIDYNYCKKNNIPIVRRILGGGAVYLDAGQLFYQIIASEDNPRIPKTIGKLFEKLLQAPIRTYHDLGIPVEYKPINDIQIQGRKISGNGVGKIGKVSILTGNLIIDFNFEEMVKILKVPTEKFRDKVATTLRERITTISLEIGKPQSKTYLMGLLKKNFEAVLDIELYENRLIKQEQNILNDLRKKYVSKGWLFEKSLSHPELVEKSAQLNDEERHLKIADGIYVYESVYKAVGGLIRMTIEIVNKKIKDILISGDFEFFPKEKLADFEKELIGLELNQSILQKCIENFYVVNKIQAPGTEPQDFTTALLLALRNIQ
jgi:lipoate-protein ligase A